MTCRRTERKPIKIANTHVKNRDILTRIFPSYVLESESRSMHAALTSKSLLPLEKASVLPPVLVIAVRKMDVKKRIQAFCTKQGIQARCKQTVNR